MSKITMDQVRSVGDFATLYNWRLQFVKIPALVKAGVSSDDLDLRCVSATIPTLTTPVHSVAVRTHTVKQHGIAKYGESITLTFVETLDNKISKFIREWREACWETKTGKQNKKADIEAIIKLTRLDKTGDKSMWEFNLFGALLTDYKFGDFAETEEGNTMKPTMTISYDYFEDKAL